jgi:hypothetical protein
VQLKKKGELRQALSAVTATLLAVTAACANDAVAQGYPSYEPYGSGNNDNFGPGMAYTELDSALLVYKEAGSRVEAIEPTSDLTIHGADGRALSITGVADAVSGATPNGAVPADQAQTFVTPIKPHGSSTTVTSASGGSTIIQLPPTPGQLATAALGRQYMNTANTLPVDKGFKDHRGALNIDWSQPLGVISQVGFGAGYSLEQDYQTITANARLAQNFNGNNTTLSLSFNTELDSSFPFGGVPTPLAVMSAQWKPVSTRQKTQMGFVAGLTEVVTRRWLMQLNYSFDAQNGYENDPYRVISIVDPVSGEPTSNIYENRPKTRQSQSLYWDNKFDFGPTVTDLSYRYFKDSWGVASNTIDVSQRLMLTPSWYIEPDARWYHQSAASFFHDFLVGGRTLPAYASSDARLAKFNGQTFGLKIGFRPSARSEFYISAEHYQQTGTAHPADAIGQLKQQTLFSGSSSTFALLGYKWDFH